MSGTFAETAAPAFDQAKNERFVDKILTALNHGALTLMLSIGHRAGLFDAMEGLAPSTSAGVAEAAGLNERYVREWLAAMVTGGVVEYEPKSATYVLPPEHAAVLTRSAVPNNLAVSAQNIPFLGAVEDAILGCFRNGGGLPYSAYNGFHRIMAEESGQTVVAALFEHILPIISSMEGRLEDGIDVLDAGCGSGLALMALAERFPASRFTGYDLTEEGITRARRQAGERRLTNVRFEQRDLSGWNDPSAFDFITTFDAVHDQKDPAGLLSKIFTALRPGGVYLMQDIGGSSHLHGNLDHPFATLLYTVSCLHCTPVSLGQGGAGLGTMWGEEMAEQMLAEAGFTSLEKKKLPHDPFNVFFVCRKA